MTPEEYAQAKRPQYSRYTHEPIIRSVYKLWIAGALMAGKCSCPETVLR